MASFDKTVLFFSLITSNRRITIAHLAVRMGCTKRHVYRMVNTASRHMPIRLENGVVIHDGKSSQRRYEPVIKKYLQV